MTVTIDQRIFVMNLFGQWNIQCRWGRIVLQTNTWKSFKGQKYVDGNLSQQRTTVVIAADIVGKKRKSMATEKSRTLHEKIKNSFYEIFKLEEDTYRIKNKKNL